MARPASSSVTQFSLIPEVTVGTTPATPAYSIIPHLENSIINLEQKYEEAAMVRSDRQGGVQVGGTFTPRGSIDTLMVNEAAILRFIESAIGGAFATITVTRSGGFAAGTKKFTATSGNFLTDPLGSARLAIGDRVTISGSVSNNGIKTITAISSTQLTFTEACVDEAGPVSVTFLSNRQVAIAGGTSRPTLSIEQQFGDLSPIVYEVYAGCEVGDATIDIPTSGAVKATFPIVGLTQALAQVAGSTYTATNNNVPDAGAVSGCSLQLGDAGLANLATLTGGESVKIDFKNGRDAKNQVGSQVPSHIEQDIFRSEVAINAYFFDETYLTKMKNGTRISAQITIVDQSKGDKYRLNFPTCCVTKTDKKTGKSITQDMMFYAEYDSTYGTKFFIEQITNI